jgi:hypothetical protein
MAMLRLVCLGVAATWVDATERLVRTSLTPEQEAAMQAVFVCIGSDRVVDAMSLYIDVCVKNDLLTQALSQNRGWTAEDAAGLQASQREQFCAPACRTAVTDYISEVVTCYEPAMRQEMLAQTEEGLRSTDIWGDCDGVTQGGVGGLIVLPSFIWAFMSGDPHLTTLDGREYTFNGLGEYWLVQDLEGSAAVQARFERCSGSSDVTCTTAIAIKVGVEDESLEIRLSADDLELQVFKAGVQIDPSNADFGTKHDRITASSANSIEVETIYGIKVKVTASAGQLTMAVATEMLLRGIMRGLYGNFNEDDTDDFILSNGTKLHGDPSEADIFDFGESWRVLEDQSLFMYSEKPYSSYHDTDYEPQLLHGVEPSAEAMLACEAAKLEGTSLHNCAVDATVTGNTAAYVDVYTVAQSMVKEKRLEECSQKILASHCSSQPKPSPSTGNDAAKVIYIVTGVVLSFILIGMCACVTTAYRKSIRKTIDGFEEEVRTLEDHAVTRHV